MDDVKHTQGPIKAYYDPEHDRVVTASQMHTMLNHQGAPGRAAATTYTEPLVSVNAHDGLVALIEEARDLASRMSDNDPIAPALVAWSRRARAAIAKTKESDRE